MEKRIVKDIYTLEEIDLEVILWYKYYIPDLKKAAEVHRKRFPKKDV